MSAVRFLPLEERLLVLLNLARPSEDELAELGRLAASKVLDWDRLFALAELNAVSALSLKRLKTQGCAVPEDLLEYWEKQVAPIEARNLLRAEWGGRLLRALHDAGVEVIVLKGSMFAEEIYGDRAYKKMNDVDVLIRRRDARRAIQVLKGLGFAGVGKLFGKNELSANSHHTPPYVSPDLGCVVGLHWGLTSPLTQWDPDTDGIWKRKSPTTVAGAPAYRMSWEDNLLHLCIHLPFFKTGLRELADAINLVRVARIDWDKLARRARLWKAEDPVYRMLALCDALVDLEVPPVFWREWKSKASWLCAADTRKRVSRPGLILESRSTQAARIEKAYAVFALSGKYSERVKAWAAMYAMLLWPQEAELKRITATPSFSRGAIGRARWLAARLQAPVRLWDAMARDHGHVPLALMTVANAGTILRASARMALRPGRDGRPLREHPAARLLEVLE